MQLFLFLFPLERIKRRALQNKQVVVLRMAFRVRKVLGPFEKRAPGLDNISLSRYFQQTLHTVNGKQPQSRFPAHQGKFSLFPSSSPRGRPTISFQCCKQRHITN